MPYFNRPLYNSFMGKKAPQPENPATYCDDCAATAIPLPEFGPDGRKGSRHYETGFRWAPHYGGSCDKCGKDC